MMFDVDPVDLPEVPGPATLVPLLFPDRRIHHAVVIATEKLEDGRVRLTCETPVAHWAPPRGGAAAAA
jgi:hypothetical protein